MPALEIYFEIPLIEFGPAAEVKNLGSGLALVLEE